MIVETCVRHRGKVLVATAALLVLDASSKDILIVETVGVGQDEVDIASEADIAIVVLVGGMLWLKNIDLRKGTSMYQADFAKVEGLRAGA